VIGRRSVPACASVNAERAAASGEVTTAFWLALNAIHCYDSLRMAGQRTPSLLESSPWLRDPTERADRILDVAESNGIIEGLPALTESARRRLHAFVAGDSSHDQAHRE
jgi:hypothetical protein